MYIQRNNAEKRLIELVKTVKGDIEQHLAIHFQLSQLQEQYQSEFQMRIAVNILNDVFRDERGVIFQTREGDIFVIYHGHNRKLVDTAIYQVRYLFADDDLAYHEGGDENADFAHVYDLVLQWRPFYRVCMSRYELMLKDVDDKIELVDTESVVLTPRDVDRIIPRLEQIDFDFVLRKQPICAMTKGREIRAVYNEVYINMAHLRRLLDVAFDLPSNVWLFNYLLAHLDRHMLALLRARPRAHLVEPLSLNLTVETVLSEEFREFCEQIKGMKREVTIVIELNVSDVFAHMHQLPRVRQIARDYKCKLCLDGLTTESLLWIDRGALGFNLMKLQWNADFKDDLDEGRNEQVKQAIERCGANRLILCRCDSEHAIEYGHALGISLFQGRHTDRVLNPETTVIN